MYLAFPTTHLEMDSNGWHIPEQTSDHLIKVYRNDDSVDPNVMELVARRYPRLEKLDILPIWDPSDLASDDGPACSDESSDKARFPRFDESAIACFGSLSWIRSITLDCLATRLDLNHLVTATAAVTPRLEALNIKRGDSLALNTLFQALDMLPRLNTLSMDLKSLEWPSEDQDPTSITRPQQGARDRYQRLHTLSLSIKEADSMIRRLLVRMFPNVKTLKVFALARELWYSGFDSDMAAQDDCPTIHSNTTWGDAYRIIGLQPFPRLTHLQVEQYKKDDKALCRLLGNPASHVKNIHRMGIKNPHHSLQGLNLRCHSTFDNCDLEALRDLLDGHGVSLKSLCLTRNCAGLDLATLLAARCCQELTELSLKHGKRLFCAECLQYQ